MTDIYVNLPTRDLERAIAFYTALGARLRPEYTDGSAACLAWDDHINVMLLTRELFATFTTKQIGDPATTLMTSTGLTCGSREEVDRTIEAGLAAGGTEPRPPDEHGQMYGRDLEDPDGNVLSFMHLPAPKAG